MNDALSLPRPAPEAYASAAAPLVEPARAKINLALHVTGRRPDAYHELDSIVVFAAIGDVLAAEPAEALSLTISGPFGDGLALESDNLVLRAASALAGWAGITPRARLHLDKRLPVASGIGGGSADAAATLRLLCRLWHLDPPAEALAVIAAGLGADVPVCLDGRPARMRGIGEHLSSLPDLPGFGLVLVNPGVAVPTGPVFQALAGRFGEALPVLPHCADPAALASALATMRNDLEAPARSLAPMIDRAHDAIAALPGCHLARMSGSGATCFGLFDDAARARQAASLIEREGWWCWGGGLADENDAARGGAKGFA